MYTDELLKKYPPISEQMNVQELRVLLSELEALLREGRQGAIVEFGCYAGTTSLFIRRMLVHYGATNAFHVYDSFEGLPPKVAEDASVAGDQFVAGELAVSKKDFLLNFKKAHLTPPTIHKGWFAELSPESVPASIMFAFLDGDYYESIHDSFGLITPTLRPDAVVIVDDYANEALPGAAKATDEWCRSHRPASLRTQSSLAVIYLAP